MQPNITIEHIDIEPDRRILVTSDIHGHLTHLKAALERASYSGEDYLIIVGDLIEKGPESLNTLRYIMNLAQHSRVIVSAGNVDTMRIQMLEGLHADNAGDLWDYLMLMRNWKGTSLFDEMTGELGLSINTPLALPGARDRVMEHFAREFDFLRGLPTIIETQCFTFVHGGLPDKEPASLIKYDLYDLLAFDRFMSSGLCFDRYVVVGHWPVTLYGEKIAQANPIINREQKIISLDGGCGLKPDGQLNMLIIPGIDCDDSEITYVSHNTFPKRRARSRQAASKDSINIRWGDNQIQPIRRAGDLTWIRHIRTGHRLWVPNDYLNADRTACNDCTDYVLPVIPGDELSLVRTTSGGSIVKKEGVTGWYYGKLDPEEDYNGKSDG